MNITTSIFNNSLKYSGVAEIPGVENNETIMTWIRSQIPWVNNEADIAWCAIFITQMFKESGLDHLIPEKPYGAIRWRDAGEIIKDVADLEIGDLVITARYSFSDWRSHIGFFCGMSAQDPDRIILFGGNQNNMVGMKPYLVSKVRYGVRIQ